MVTEVGKLVFIGGAPRSGTTLLSNMLDSHPDFLVFPMEHAVFETYFNCPDKNVFHSKFITDRALGQQAILGNSEAYQAYKQKVQRVPACCACYSLRSIVVHDEHYHHRRRTLSSVVKPVESLTSYTKTGLRPLI